MNAEKQPGRGARLTLLIITGVTAAEVLIMMSPFAGLFYATMDIGPFRWLSRRPLTAWLNGFFLNHSVVTTSPLLEWQREISFWMLLLGLAGFAAAAALVYGSKARGGGVARRSLYRFVRHPQYLCLAVAGWGLLSSWPRFLLLGIWVTMLFLYAGLARFEERRMEERFGDEYREFAAQRGSFLPGSPIRRLFEATFGRLRPRPLGWVAAWLCALALTFSGAFALREATRNASPIVVHEQDRLVMISVWPQSAAWIEETVRLAALDSRVWERLRLKGARTTVVATILPPGYPMRDMYYDDDPNETEIASLGPLPATRKTDARDPTENSDRLLGAGVNWPFLYRFATMGRPPQPGDTVQIVYSIAGKAYKRNLPPAEALDPAVQLTPAVVVDFIPSTKKVIRVRFPPPRNAWGADVVMPLF